MKEIIIRLYSADDILAKNPETKFRHDASMMEVTYDGMIHANVESLSLNIDVPHMKSGCLDLDDWNFDIQMKEDIFSR